MAAYSAPMGGISTSPHTAFFVITLSTYSFLTIQSSIINAADLENGLQESRERERERLGILRRKAQLDMSNQYYALCCISLQLYLTTWDEKKTYRQQQQKASRALGNAGYTLTT